MEIGACSVSITDHDKDTVQEEPIFREPLTSPDQSLLLYNKAITSEYWKRCNVVSHFPGTVDLMAVAILVQATFELDRLPSYSVDNIPDRDWVVHVQSSWKPIVVGQIILRFPWHSNEDVQTAIVDSFNDEETVVDETKTHLVLQLEGGIAFGTGEHPKEMVVDETKTHLVLQLEGGIAFGTGEHPTTRLCLLWIERLLSQHEISLFLDFGAGSGVLGMAACIIGKHRNKPMRSVGIEIDSDAIIIANKNSEYNGCNMNTYLPRLLGNEDDETITFILKALQRNNGVGHLPQELSGQIYDACAMNILAGPLIMLQETVAQMIRPGGRIGLSGVLSHQADQVVQAYRKYFDSVKIEQEDSGWVLITGIRKK
jgi:ribosomal protein L11 methyltransferase